MNLDSISLQTIQAATKSHFYDSGQEIPDMKVGAILPLLRGKRNIDGDVCPFAIPSDSLAARKIKFLHATANPKDKGELNNLFTKWPIAVFRKQLSEFDHMSGHPSVFAAGLHADRDGLRSHVIC
ncbi:hypothetical protein P8935_16775 [Telmatobacter sp. DSM 110680]|uniref:Uncharacterized protein n=1 Tax=Telmatobacter sp. DSM 110680 TaxID=3036704 RepID=A0AAU7DG19_9BACT